MKNILIIVFLGLGLSSCFEYEDIEFVKMGGFKLEEIAMNRATIGLTFEMLNPNGYAITIKPSTLDVYVDDEYVGKASLLEKVRLKRKKSQLYGARIQLVGEGGIMQKLMQVRQKEEVTLRFTGKVKGSVLGISKNISVNESKTINPSELKMPAMGK
jgi:LEA14-like dessication related protein